MKRLAALAVVAGALTAPAAADAESMHGCSVGSWKPVTLKVGPNTTCNFGRAVMRRLGTGPVWKADRNGSYVLVWTMRMNVTRPNKYTDYYASNRAYDQRVYVNIHHRGG